MDTISLVRLPETTPQDTQDAIDADYIDASADVGCTCDLVKVAERSAHLIDDEMNAAEAEEERNAASEAQAMR